MMRESTKIDSNDRDSFDFITIKVDESIINPMIKTNIKLDKTKENKINKIDDTFCCNCLITNIIG
jgi:hypothetical protein